MTVPNPPIWLPEIINVDGDPDVIRPLLYSIFTRDVKNGSLTHLGCPLIWNTGVRNDIANPKFSYEEGFWHLLERKNQKTKIREFDPRRAERLSWVKAVIDHHGQQEIMGIRLFGLNPKM